MFNTIIDAYNKYVLIDNRINELEKRIETLEKKLAKASPDKYTCKSCFKGQYKQTNTPRFFHGMVVGKEWKCDKCGHVADELTSQALSKG